VLTSSTPLLLCFLVSDRHDDVTMLIATVSLYKELDTISPSSSSDRTQCEPRLFVPTVVKKLKKEGEDFDFIFYGFTLEGKSMSLLTFFVV
jgi:hypothetical protein